MIQMQLSLTEAAMEALKASASKKGISPNILARLILHEQFGQPDAESKSYTFSTRSWRELEAYIKVRNLGTVEGFAPVALDMAISRNRLSARQKAEFERLLVK
jgi:hypothetical protein